MDEMMKTLLEMTMYGSIAIVVVLIFRVIFKKFPKKVMILIWIVAAFRLLCPYNFDTGVGLAKLIPEKQIVQVMPAPAKPAVSMGTEHVNKARALKDPSKAINIKKNNTVAGTSGNNVVIDAADAEQKTSIDIKPMGIVCAVWVAGMTAVALLSAANTIKVIHKTRKFKVTGGGYMESDEISTPFAVGIIKPTICIPSTLDESEKEYMMLHEKIHLKNCDPALKCLALGIVCVHWFNPLVWLAYRLFLSDLEMRCDEEVVDKMGDDIRKRYCLSIVNHSVDESGFRVISTAFAGKTFGGMEVKMRINNLIKYKKMPVIASALTLAIAGGSAFALSACATGEAKETKKLTADTKTALTANVEAAGAKVEDWEEYYLSKYGTDKITKGLKADSIDNIDYTEENAIISYTLGNCDLGHGLFFPNVEFSSLEEFDSYFSAANYEAGDYDGIVKLNYSYWQYISKWDKKTIDKEYPDNENLHYPELSSSDTEYRKTYTYGPDKFVFMEIWYDTEDRTLHTCDNSEVFFEQ